MSPDGFHVVVMDNQLVIYLLGLLESFLDVQASIVVKPDSTVAVCINRKAIPSAHYQDILQDVKGVQLGHSFVLVCEYFILILKL